MHLMNLIVGAVMFSRFFSDKSDKSASLIYQLAFNKRKGAKTLRIIFEHGNHVINKSSVSFVYSVFVKKSLCLCVSAFKINRVHFIFTLSTFITLLP
jgi:hypothetical protein